MCVSLLGACAAFRSGLWYPHVTFGICYWTALADLCCADLCRWVCVQSGESPHSDYGYCWSAKDFPILCCLNFPWFIDTGTRRNTDPGPLKHGRSRRRGSPRPGKQGRVQTHTQSGSHGRPYAPPQTHSRIASIPGTWGGGSHVHEPGPPSC